LRGRGFVWKDTYFLWRRKKLKEQGGEETTTDFSIDIFVEDFQLVFQECQRGKENTQKTYVRKDQMNLGLSTRLFVNVL